MTPLRPFGWADALLLMLILSVAGGMRGGYLWRYADAGRSDGICTVQADGNNPYWNDNYPENLKITRQSVPSTRDLDSLVSNIEKKQWFGSKAPFASEEETTAHYSPGYPYLLGWLARAIGSEDPVRLHSWVRWAQCGLSTLTAGLYFLFARRAFRSLAVGTLAGLFVAANPFAILNSAEIQDGVVTSFLVAFVLFVGSRATHKAVPLGSLCYGLGLAGLSLVRAACLPFAFVALIWYLLRCRTLERGWLCAILAFLGFANGLAPWMVRNWQTFGEPVPIVDSMYLHLWIGNNPRADGGPLSEHDLESPSWRGSLEAIPGSEQPRRYGQLTQMIYWQVAANPGGTLYRRLAAGFKFLFGDRFFLGGVMEEPGGLIGLNETLLAVMLGVIPLAFIGWRWSYGWRRESMPAALAVLWLPLPYILGHAEWLHGPRLPLDGVLLTFAAFGFCCLIPFLGKTLREGAVPAAKTDPGTTPLPGLPHPSSAPLGAGRGPSWR